MLYQSVCSYKHITYDYNNCQHRAGYFYEVVVSRFACLPKLVLLPSVLTGRNQTLYNAASKKQSLPKGCFYCVWGSKYRFCVPQNHGSVSRKLPMFHQPLLHYDFPNTKHTKEKGRSPEEARGRTAPISRQGLFRRGQLPEVG